MFSIGFILVVLYAVFIGALEVGHWIRRRREASGESSDGHGGMVTTFTLSLLSLILAFSLSAARDSFSRQQELVIHEARAIHEASVTSRMLSPESTEKVLDGLRELIQHRRAYNQSLSFQGDQTTRESYIESQKVLYELFEIVSSIPGTEEGAENRQALLLRLSEVREVAAERWVIENNEESWFPSALTTLLAIISAILVGQSLSGTRKQQRGYRAAFALSAALTIALISDFGNPRVGVVRVDFVDKLLEQPL